MAATIEEVRALLRDKSVRRELMSKPNVIATGVGYKVTNGKPTDQLSLICSVATKQRETVLTEMQRIPRTVQSIPTDVYPTGPIHALINRRSRVRPAPGGVSVGHINITAGTLGCLVKKNNTQYILSNNHVLANSNEAAKGDPILQPGPADGGEYPLDRIAELSDYVPINFEGGDSTCPFAGLTASILNALAALTGSKTKLKPVNIQAEDNRVDCAIAKPVNPDDVINEILDIGTINGSAEGTLGMAVQKSGRTTGYTKDSIIQVDVTSKVSYGTNKTATFVDQLMAGAMSQGGDSGSAVLDMENRIVGLLFAGSNTTTIINPIQFVFDELGVTLP